MPSISKRSTISWTPSAAATPGTCTVTTRATGKSIGLAADTSAAQTVSPPSRSSVIWSAPTSVPSTETLVSPVSRVSMRGFLRLNATPSADGVSEPLV